MSLFKEYMAEVDSGHDYIFKTVLPLDERAIDRIKYFFSQYDLLEMSPPTQTPVQREPLEFYDMNNMAVWIIKFKLRMPIAKDIASCTLADMFGVPRKYFVIRGEGDPIELEQKKIATDEEIEQNDSYDVRLLDPEYKDAPAFEDDAEDGCFGDEYNTAMLSRIQKVRAEFKTELDAQSKKFRGDQ